MNRRTMVLGVSLLGAVLLLGWAPATRAETSLKENLCQETCSEKEKLERQEGCQTGYDTCANACPSGLTGRACKIPCNATRKSCEDKASKRKGECIQACNSPKK